MYEYQGFHSGEKLKATQLVAMEDGIINAEKLAIEGDARAANIEKGTGENATQQTPRADKIHDTDGKKCFTISEEIATKAGINTEVEYGSVGNFTATLNGRSSAQAKHATAIGNSTVALGEESFAQGYEAIAKGNSAMAAGSQVYAVGEASVAHGLKTQAKGNYSYAGGARTQANAELSQATGVDTVADGYASSANGQGTVADQSAQFVVGKYNAPREGSVFQVGAGHSPDEKINGLDVLQGGEVIIYWEEAYYSLNLMLNLIANAFGGGPAFFDAAKKQ